MGIMSYLKNLFAPKRVLRKGDTVTPETMQQLSRLQKGLAELQWVGVDMGNEVVDVTSLNGGPSGVMTMNELRETMRIPPSFDRYDVQYVEAWRNVGAITLTPDGPKYEMLPPTQPKPEAPPVSETEKRIDVEGEL